MMEDAVGIDTEGKEMPSELGYCPRLSTVE